MPSTPRREDASGTVPDKPGHEHNVKKELRPQKAPEGQHETPDEEDGGEQE